MELELAVKAVKKPLLACGIVDKLDCDLLFPEFEGMIGLSEDMVVTIGIVER